MDRVQYYSELAEQTTHRILSSTDEWASYLTAAARIHKYGYKDQLMIYAQRPDATAVATYELWNQTMHRYVRKGSRGIVLLDQSGDQPALSYVYDVADTGTRASSRYVYIWAMEDRHRQPVREMLVNVYGVQSDRSIEDQLLFAANAAVERYWETYSSIIQEGLDKKLLERYSIDTAGIIFQNAVIGSVAYQLCSRCLGNTESINLQDFVHAEYFESLQSVNCLGHAVNRVADEVFRNIERTIRNYERSQTNEHNHLQTSGRLPDSEHRIEQRRDEAPGQVRSDAPQLSGEQQSDPVRSPEPDWETVPPSSRDSGSRTEPIGTADAAAPGTEPRSEQGDGSDGLGAAHEQPEISGRGDHPDGADSQLSFLSFPTEAEQIQLIENAERQSLPAFSFSQEEVDLVLQCGLNDAHGRQMVALEYMKQKSTTDIAGILPSIYKGGFGLKTERRNLAVLYDADGIHIAVGSGVQNKAAAQHIAWQEAAERIGILLEEGRYATNVELAEAPGYELREAAADAWYFLSDVKSEIKAEGYLSTVQSMNQPAGFPEATERMSELLTDKTFRSILCKEVQEVLDVHNAGRNMMRFRSNYRRGVNLVKRVDELNLPLREYVTQMAVPPVMRQFITDDEIDYALSRGNGFYGGKDRIYEFWNGSHTPQEKAEHLKQQYGIGGHNNAFLGSFRSQEDHDSRGLRFQKPECETVMLPWNHVVKRIDQLIAEDRFFTPNEKEERKAQENARLSEIELQEGLESTEVTLELDSPDTRVAESTELDLSENQTDLDRAINLINDFCVEEYSREADVSDLSKVDIAYITAEEYPLEIQATADLVSSQISITMDGVQIRTEQYASLSEMIDKALVALDFNELIAYSPSDLDKVLKIKQYDIRQSLIQKNYEDLSDIDFAIREFIPDETTIEMDGRQFLVDRLNFGSQTVNLQDITFQNETGFPIFRTEPFHIVRRYFENQLHREHETAKPLSIQVDGHESPEAITDRRLAENFHITDPQLGAGSAKEKFAANIQAILLLKELEESGAQANPEQQIILSRYVGWGGLADAFDPNKGNWNSEYLQLKSLLTDQEYTAARASTLNAHYTSPTIIQGIYDAVGQMGFESGNILEPAMGVGNFFGMLPPEMRASRLYGVELDSLSGRIAQQLYPQANITIAGFETTDRKDFYDLAIGNVPFGDYKVNDKSYDKHNLTIHNYFLVKSIDQVRPGGIAAFVTSRYTMDAKNSAARKLMAQKADLLGAIRLPNTAFKENAGTEVVSDILFFQKRETPSIQEPDWVHLNTTEDGFTMNSYFVEHPEMVLGETAWESGPFGQQMTVASKPGAVLSEQLAAAIQHIGGTYIRGESIEIETERSNVLPAAPDVKNYSYTVVDGEVYFRENSIMRHVELKDKAKDRVVGMVNLREIVNDLISYQLEDYPDDRITEKQQELNAAYDSFTAKHGLINASANAKVFSDDDSYHLLCSLENLDEDKNLKSKAAMFTKRTIKPDRAVTTAETPAEALAISIGYKGAVDLGYMAELLGTPGAYERITDELKGVIFKDPLSPQEDILAGWQTADEYLSGDIRSKLRIAKLAAENNSAFQVNVDSLEKAMPQELTASEIDIRLGATWIEPEHIQDFMHETFETPFYYRRHTKVHFSSYTAEWRIEGKNPVSANDVAACMTYGTSRANAYKILEDTLNLRDVRIYDTYTDVDGNQKRVLNNKETTLAQQKQQSIKNAFQDWIWQDPHRRNELVEKYNELFNSTRPREYDGSHIVFSGMTPDISLREHQKNAIARIVYGGNTLVAHEVGAGKSFTMTAAAMIGKQLGLCQKSLFVVPNHLTEQWSSEFLRLYPSANLLVASKKDFETANRKKFCARIATGEYDAIIIGHSQFEKIPLSTERQTKILEDQIQEIEDAIMDEKIRGGEHFTIKQMEKTRRTLETKLKNLMATERKDDVVTFEQLGVDRLFVDESHLYKNLFLYTKMRNVAGLSTSEAQKSSDMFMKCRYLDEVTGGRGIIFATGTPVSNSMTELYTVMRYLQYGTLQKKNLTHFDAWASTFGETVTAIELAPEGTGYRARTRFAKFFNLPELMTLFKEVADIKTSDQLNLPVPEVRYETVVVPPSDIQKDLVCDLSERASRVHQALVDPSEDNMLRITSDGRKIGLDQRLINPMLPDDPNSKLNACVRNVERIYHEGTEQKLTQLLFCDFSTPKKDGTFSVYNDIRDKLTDHGIPKEEIAFIHDADTEVKKDELFRKVRTGQVRVLLGSTAKMGAGTNCQDRLIAVHHLDVGWRPADMTQRNGRIIRQGNQNPEVQIYQYVTEGTFDAYLYQTLENKQKFVSQIMTSKSPVRSCDDVDEQALSYAEIKALCAGSPLIKEKMDLDVEVAKLRLMKSDHQSKQFKMQDMLLKYYPTNIELYKSAIEHLQEDLKTVDAHPLPDEGFVGMTICGTNYSEKQVAGEALLAASKLCTTLAPVNLGQYRGFDLELSYAQGTIDMVLKGKTSHRAVMGNDARGNLIRLDNALSNIGGKIESAETKLEDLYKQRDATEAKVNDPFPLEVELAAKAARLVELDNLLSMDQAPTQEHSPDHADESPFAKQIAALPPVADVPAGKLRPKLVER